MLWVIYKKHLPKTSNPSLSTQMSCYMTWAFLTLLFITNSHALATLILFLLLSFTHSFNVIVSLHQIRRGQSPSPNLCGWNHHSYGTYATFILDFGKDLVIAYELLSLEWSSQAVGNGLLWWNLKFKIKYQKNRTKENEEILTRIWEEKVLSRECITLWT